MPIFHQFRDTTIYWSKLSVFIAVFTHPVSFEALARSLSRTCGMKVGVKTSVPGLPDTENRVILRAFVCTWYRLVTDRRTDEAAYA